MAAMKLAQDDISGRQTKHVDIMYHIISNNRSAKHRNAEHYSTPLTAADVLKKPLPRISLKRCQNYCGLNEGQK